MAAMNFQDFLNGLKDLIAQAEGANSEGAEGEAEPGAPEEAPTNEEAESPADVEAEKAAGGVEAGGPSKTLANFLSKPKKAM